MFIQTHRKGFFSALFCKRSAKIAIKPFFANFISTKSKLIISDAHNKILIFFILSPNKKQRLVLTPKIIHHFFYHKLSLLTKFAE